MKTKLYSEIEKKFRESDNPDELFDAVRLAIENNYDYASLYKILLANSALTKDEIIFFTEKLISVFDNCYFELCMWTAEIFQNCFHDVKHKESAFLYYQKASMKNPESCLPLMSSLELYNYDYEEPINKIVLSFINIAIEKVIRKIKVYDVLANHFEKMGNKLLVKKYRKLIEIENRNNN